ncbi:MAG: efflux RND transporter permease subunit [Spirochaetaceae bacterium]|jgi:multidrug efflux pump subunit AcrB|nr:efflux RND transporter permease subunit [Spirochaetaceae bacterium]
MKQELTLKHGFIGRPVAALCVCAALLCVGAIVIFERGRAGPGMSGQDFYAVSLKHYGVDAREMERSVTIPLEDALYALPGVKQVTSVSDNAQSRVSVLFAAGKPGDRAGRYEAVSDAAQRVYETLPQSAQRPEILSHDDNRAPVWTAAVTGADPTSKANKTSLAAFLERTVKGELEAIEGVAEVQIAGAALPEVLISLDNERCARMGLSAQSVAAVLARNDALIPAGVLESGGTEINVLVDGRYRTIDELGGAFIPLPEGGYTQLRNIAAVIERERQPDILSRLNGEQTVMLIVTASPDADLGKLSRSLARNVERYGDLSFEVLADRGKEEIKALHSVLAAALGGSLMVAILSVLMTAGSGGIREAAACALTVPFISVLSLALLSLFQPPGKSTLTGLTAGLGVAVDAAILVSEKLSGVLSKTAKTGTADTACFPAAKKQLRALIPPLTAGSATTIAALVPFAFMKNTAIAMSAEMQTIALSIGVITVVSFFTALILLPPLFLSGTQSRPQHSAQSSRAGKKKVIALPDTVSRRAIRLFSRIVHTSVRKPGFVIALSAAFVAAAFVVVVMSDPDTRMPFSEDSLYAQVEFDGGLLKEETDRKLAVFARALRQNDGVKHVETGAKTGTGNVYITFDPQKITPEKMREITRSTDIPGGFVYIDELTGSERSWRISVSGDDDAQCRLIVRKIAEICSRVPLVEETVLHFKNGGPRLALKPDRQRLAAAGISFASLGDTERRAVHAPVAYKRLGSVPEETGIRGETDVRIQAGRGKNAVAAGTATTESPPEKADVENITLVTDAGAAVSVSSLVTMESEEEVSVIRREDRRRTASLSVRTKAIGAHKARSLIMPSLSGIALPQNYTITFDREAIEAEEALGKSVFYVVLALVFCYIVIAMANESFFLPLIALAAVPPSLALPVLVLSAAGFKMNAALICAFIAVTGITVNASTLTVDALCGKQATFPAVYRALRGRLNALLATGGTTIAAALPFVFLPENTNLMIKTLALVSALGVAGSGLTSVTLIPALTALITGRYAGSPPRSTN